MEEYRVNPDKILKQIETEEAAGKKGKLKIFFGYAAGVGKTYAMLKAAHAAKRRGVDVVNGYLEPHDRPDTIALLKNLEQIPNLVINHKGIRLKELHLDAALKRHPELVLVDELAHTNAEGCRHKKRYQDIEELLNSGIDVYTTVNVQHIESLNDMIASITGVTVQERIPDSVFDDAHQVELVDIEPQELKERLNAGKIYGEKQAQRALANFFDLKNLTALREIALRRCADRINRISECVRQAQRDEYYTDEHILVCISSSPTNPRIIRTAARMANAFRGSFTALFVETSDYALMEEDDKKRLQSNIQLAGQLGAQVETVYGNDIPYHIAEYARLAGVSKIVVGRSSMKRRFFFSKPSLTEKLIAFAPGLDIHIIPDKDTPVFKRKNQKKNRIKFAVADIMVSILLWVAVTLISFIFQKLGFSDANIITVYILGVLLTAVFTTQKIYSLVFSIVSVLTFNYFFTHPYFTLRAYDEGYPVTFVIMFLSAFISSSLAVQMKQQTKQASEAAYRTKILLETNQLIQRGKGKEAVAKVMANQLSKLLRRNIVIYLSENGALAEPIIFTFDNETDSPEYLTVNERAVAEWVFKNNKHAGATTNTLGNSRCLYLAIRTNETVYGVVGICMNGEPLDTFENSMMLSILGECALAFENETALREREQAAVLAKNEQLRANLLRSISHDLRTPLTSISGNAGILMTSGDCLDDESKRQLYLDIYDDSLWLINLVENLLSVTRIEDGTMKLKMAAELMEEVISEALKHINRKSSEHNITVIQMEEFIMAKIDARLIVQVIINIVDNAIKYTQEGSEIKLIVSRKGGKVIVDISDNGEGIDDNDKKNIFDMFYTVNRGAADSRRSLGLGLALCKSIIAAHGGEIMVLDNQPKGSVFRFTLPEEEVILRE